MRLKNTKRPCIEKLEDRWVPASFNFQGSGTTLTLTQTSGTIASPLTITDDVTAGTISITDNAVTTVVPVGNFPNLTINYLGSDTAAVYAYNLTGMRSGNVTLNVLNNTTRTLNLDAGGANSIGGNFSVTGGNAALTVSENGAPTGLTVGGNATFTGGLATDVLNLTGGAAPGSIGGNVTVTKFNTVSFNTDTIGGSLNFNDSGETTANTLTLTGTTVGSSISYTGGNSTDVITLAGAAVVGSNLTVNFGTQVGVAPVSSLSLTATTSVGGNLSVTGGNLGTQNVTLAATATLSGNATFNMGNATTNSVSFLGTFNGSSFNYIGGSGTDTITYTLTGGSRARFTAQLGAGADSVAFGTGAFNPSYAYIDFGAGADSVSGTINFPFTFLNLP